MGKPHWLQNPSLCKSIKGNNAVTFELVLYFWNPSIKILSVINLCNIGYFITGSKVPYGLIMRRYKEII